MTVFFTKLANLTDKKVANKKEKAVVFT